MSGLFAKEIFWGSMALFLETAAMLHLYPTRKFIRSRTVFALTYGGLLAVINTWIFCYNDHHALVFFLPYLGLMTLAFFLDMDYISLLAAVMLFPTVCMQAAFLTMPVINHFFEAPVSDILTMVFPRMLLIPLFFYLRHFTIPGENKIPLGYSVPSIFVSAISIVVVYFGGTTDDSLLLTINGMLLGLNILMYYMYYRLSMEYMERARLQLKKKFLEDLMNYTENLGVLYDNLRKVRHDTANHFTIVHQLLEEGNYEQAKEYFQRLEDGQEQVELFVGSDNAPLNAILNAKRSLALNKGIKADLRIYLPEKIILTDVEFCAIIGNLMDNALEACGNRPGAELLVQIMQKQGYLLMDVRNTIAHSVISKNPNLETTKKEKEFHGLGLQIVRESVSRHNGTASFYEQEGNFIVQISIPNPQ